MESDPSGNSNRKKRLITILAIVVITILALGLRGYAANTLYIDFDEPVYMRAALEYTNHIREGKFTWLAWNTTNYEHPSLYKILYGAAFLFEDPIDQFYRSDTRIGIPMIEAQAIEYGMLGRWISVTFGTLTVLAATIINPVAGFFLAVNTFSVKYTSLVYLEALPMLASFLSLLAYLVYFRKFQERQKWERKSYLWLGLSALLMGITAASKYVYGIVALTILSHAIISVMRKKAPMNLLWIMSAWGILALVSFFIFNPYLWPDPIGRLQKSLAYHASYPESQNVLEHPYPWWQPIQWLFRPFISLDPKPTSAFLIKIDPVIFFLAVIGLPRTCKKQLIYFLWLVLGLATLLLWGTKWPQYVMIIMVPYTMAAAQGAATIVDGIKSLFFKTRKPSLAV